MTSLDMFLIKDHPQKTSPQRGREGGTKNAQKGDFTSTFEAVYVAVPKQNTGYQY